MGGFPKISIHTQVYNTKKEYLEQCVDSVLNQTYSDFEYFLIDNGSNVATKILLQNIAKKDSRIILKRFEENDPSGIRVLTSLQKNSTAVYATIIDSDDWWELDYLEKLISFLEEENLDISVCGTYSYIEKTKRETVLRALDKSCVITQKEFAKDYKKFWTFPSTIWGCIFKVDLYKKINVKEFLDEIPAYGSDTALTLQYIRLCKKIGIVSDPLYHYRRYPESISYKYDFRRLSSNVVLHKKMKDFLEINNAFDNEKRNYFKKLLLKSLVNTLNILRYASLSSNEKLLEVKRIIEEAEKQDVFSLTNLDCAEFNFCVSIIFTENIFKLTNIDGNFILQSDIKSMLKKLSPDCYQFFEFEYLNFFKKERVLWDALIYGKKNEFIVLLLELLKNGKYKNKYNLYSLVKKLENVFFNDIKNEEFFALYTDVVKLVLASQNSMALDRMTEIMLSGEEVNCPEDFLDIYIKLASLENHAEAFIFGNIQKAYLFIDENRKNEARQIVNDLVEMGLDENDENIIELEKMLNDE